METEVSYLNDFHKKNSLAAMEDLKKQKPISREEAIAQYKRNKAKLQELNGNAITGNSLTSKED